MASRCPLGTESLATSGVDHSADTKRLFASIHSPVPKLGLHCKPALRRRRAYWRLRRNQEIEALFYSTRGRVTPRQAPTFDCEVQAYGERRRFFGQLSPLVPSINSSCVRLASCLQPGMLGSSSCRTFREIGVGSTQGYRCKLARSPVAVPSGSDSSSGVSSVIMMETTDLWNGSHFAHRR